MRRGAPSRFGPSRFGPARFVQNPPLTSRDPSGIASTGGNCGGTTGTGRGLTSRGSPAKPPPHRTLSKEPHRMALRVAINGFGRIGRLVLRSIVEFARRDIEVVSINALGPIESFGHLLRYDSVHGRFPGVVSVTGDAI